MFGHPTGQRRVAGHGTMAQPYQALQKDADAEQPHWHKHRPCQVVCWVSAAGAASRMMVEGFTFEWRNRLTADNKCREAKLTDPSMHAAPHH